MKKKVAVILSAYNGEKYIAEQLLSLANQTYQDIDIFIHDDGSTDNTPKIICEFAERFSNFHIVNDTPGQKYPQCFIRLLKQVEGYDYYAFCDQDDVWYENKLSDGIDSLESIDNEQPLLYYTAVDYCDSDLKFIRHSRFAQNMYEITPLCLTDVLFGGEAMGMTFIFNSLSRNELLKANEHGDFKDWFLKVYCAACGKVLYNPVSSAKYRRHNEAVTGKSNPSGKFQRYCSQIKDIFLTANTFDDQRQIIALLNREYLQNISEDDKRLLSLFSEPNSMLKKMQKVFYKKRFRRKLLDEIGYRIAFAIGRI